MAIESATYLSDLDPANPKGVDQRGTADNHIRLCKQVWVNSFPNINAEVSASAGELNYMVGVTSNVQNQLNNEVATREASSATLQLAIHVLSATMANRAQAASASCIQAVQDLSATLNAAKLDLSATAAAAVLWGSVAPAWRRPYPHSPHIARRDWTLTADATAPDSSVPIRRHLWLPLMPWSCRHCRTAMGGLEREVNARVGAPPAHVHVGCPCRHVTPVPGVSDAQRR